MKKRSFRAFVSCVSAAIFVTGLSYPASAATIIPDAVLNGNGDFAYLNDQPLGPRQDNISDAYGTYALDIRTSSVPSLAVSVAGGARGGVVGFTYYMLIGGPDGLATIHINSMGLSEIINSTHPLDSWAGSKFQMVDTSDPSSAYRELPTYNQSLAVDQWSGSTPNVIDYSSNTIDYDVSLYANHLYAILLQANVLASTTGSSLSGAESLYTMIDPKFTVTGDNASDYTLSFSEGIGNGDPVEAAVPEPTTWALMLIGFGFIGFAMRRQRQQPQVRFAF
jgi:hypothetical protein